MTTAMQAFEAWDQDGSYADWKEFNALTKNEQFFLCWQAATLAERERAARVCESLGMTTNGIYERNQECADKIRSGE